MRNKGYNDSALAPVFGTAHFNDKAFRSVDTGWKWKEPVEGERKTPEEEGNRLAMESMVAMAESKLADGVSCTKHLTLVWGMDLNPNIFVEDHGHAHRCDRGQR